MRVFILFIVILACIPAISAETVIYSGWLHSGDTFTIDKPDFQGDIFSVTYFVYSHDDDTQNKLLLKRNNRGTSYRLSEDDFGNLVSDCKEDVFYRYCFETADWTWEKEKSGAGHLEYRGGEEYPGLYIKIYQIGPDLAVKRTSTAGGTINLNEETKIAIELSNKGDKRADTIYSEFPPSWLNIYSSSGFTKDFSARSPSLIQDSFLTPEQVITLSYRFKPLSYDTITIPASLEYTYENRTLNKSVASLTISIVKPYDFLLGLSSATTGVQETTTLTLTFKDNDKFRPLQGKVTVFIPPEIGLFSQQIPMTKTGDYYSFSINVPPGDSYVQTVSLRGLTTGVFNITALADMTFPNEKFTVNAGTIYTVEGTKGTAGIRFVGEEDRSINGVIEAGKDFRVVADFKNMDDVQNIKDIKGQVAGPLLEKPIDISLPVLAPMGVKKFVDETLTAPITNKRKTYTFWFNGTFKTASDELSNFTSFATIAIEPAGGDYLEITQDISEGIITRGNNVSVKVLVKNLKPYPLYKLDVEDTHSDSVNLVGGLVRNTVDLDAQENKQAYLYRLFVPENYTLPSINITTHVAFQEYTIEKSSEITINGPVEENTTEVMEPITNTTNTTEEPKPPEPVVVEPEKKGGVIGFLEGVFKFIKGLFGLGIKESNDADKPMAKTIAEATAPELKEEFRKIASSKPTYVGVYSMAISSQGKTSNSEYTNYMKGDKYRIDSQTGGNPTRNFISANEVVVCANENGWRCARAESAENLDPVGMAKYADGSIEYAVRKLPGRIVANTTTACYEIKPDQEGIFEYCVSQESIPLYIHVQGTFRGFPFDSVMIAQRYGFDVADSDFEPPSIPQET